MEEIAGLISDVASDLPGTLLDSLVEGLTHAGAGDESVQKVLNEVHSVKVRSRLRDVLRMAGERGLNSDSVALALQAAFVAHRHCRDSHSVEMVWTGPSPPATTLRRTDQVLLQVIDKAQRDLWIVSFSAYRVRNVLNAINRASERGVNVVLILESSDESEGKLSEDQIAEIRSELSADCRFYVWPIGNREANEFGKRGLLHAKCALSDSKNLFVSSANLSEAALRRNIELGVLLTSENHAKQIRKHLVWLVESKTLKRF